MPVQSDGDTLISVCGLAFNNAVYAFAFWARHDVADARDTNAINGSRACNLNNGSPMSCGVTKADNSAIIYGAGHSIPL